jgi:hypothetical protein
MEDDVSPRAVLQPIAVEIVKVEPRHDSRGLLKSLGIKSEFYNRAGSRNFPSQINVARSIDELG